MVRADRYARLPEIAAAATEVFGKVGYKRTRTADVAAQPGYSTGGLFTYVESKEALFHLVFLAAFDELDSVTELPVRVSSLEVTLALIERGLRKLVRSPRLQAAVRTDDVDDIHAE